MASTLLGSALRHIQVLFNDGTVAGLADSELLERFATRRDTGAFEALVQRHGPMVLAVCRGVLKDPNDAEDAFQATFLVLVRKAGSLWAKRGSLGSWLYRVAYRIAIQANVDAARRREIERRAREMVNPNSRHEKSSRDIVPALHEEIGRLPEKYRAPVVLCHLERMTHAEAACQLGWTVGMVRGRVAKARGLLRARLTRRGLAPSGVFVAAALSEQAALAAVPRPWIDATVGAAATVAGQAAVGDALRSVAVSLSERILKNMFMTKLKITLTAVLAAGGAALLASLAAPGLGGNARHLAPLPAHGNSEPKAAAAMEVKAINPASDPENQPLPISGRVVDPDGNPVAGAKLYVTPPYEIDRTFPPQFVRATSGPDGRFRFEATSGELGAWSRVWNKSHPIAVAMADGYGPGFDLEATKAGEHTIRLARDDIPVEGRILDLEGRPVVGARVQVISISWVPDEDLSRWRQALQSEQAAYPVEYRVLKSWASPGLTELIPPLLTGPDGRFTIVGIGRERIAAIVIDGPSIRTTFEHVVTRRDPPVRVPSFAPPNLPCPVTYFGARLDYVAEPSRPIVGVVRDKDTGKPLAGAVVRSTTPFANPVRFVQTRTDASGRYRLTGLNTLTAAKEDGDIGEQMIVLAPKGEPYLPAVQAIIEPAAAAALTRDFALKRGIWVRGRVIDKSTGEPRKAMVDYYLFADNPHASEVPDFGYDDFFNGHYRTDDHGTFRLVGLPGRGLLCASAIDGSAKEPYRMGVGADGIKEKKMTIDLETIAVRPSSIIVNNFHVLREINPPDGVDEARYDLALERGIVIKGRLIDPAGHPLAGARAGGLTDWWSEWTKPLATADFGNKNLGDVKDMDK